MKVLHLIGGGDTGGAKTHVLNLLQELNKNIDAQLVCFRKGDFSEEAEKMDIPITVIESGNPLTGLREIKKLIGNQTIDIIHCHGARGNLMGHLLKKHVNAPVVTTVHSDYRLDYLGRPVARLSYGTTYTYILRRVNYYIGVSDPMTDILIDRNFPPEKIYTIYNGIDFKTPIKCMERDDFFKSIGFQVQPGDIVAGIAARLTPVKDIPTLLNAMAVACKQVKNLKLVIAGDGEDEKMLKQMAVSLGIGDKVCFAGWLKDINSFYNALDINLLTSISETFPYALTEGVRMKCATIASRVGGVPVLIDDGMNGLIFEPRNIEQLAEHLVTLTTDEALRLKMGNLLYEKASIQFSIDKMCMNQLAIYQSILERHQRQITRCKRDGIIICGAYGYGNAGDDAILQSIITSVKGIDKNMPITILAKNTMNIKQTFRVNAIYTFNIPAMLNAMRRSLLYINGGGSLIQNVTSSRSLAYYLFTLRAAKLLGNKVDMYGCGIGPVQGKQYGKMVANVLNRSVDTITLREEHSKRELERFGVTKPNILVTSDPALVLQPVAPEISAEALKKYGLSPEGRYQCHMLRTWYGYSEKVEHIARCADYVYEKYGLTTVFISMNIINDPRAVHQVTAHMKSPYIIVEDKIEPEMLVSILSYMQVVVAMRLHGLIFSSISGIPLIGISYDPKLNSFIDYLGYGDCINLDDVTTENLIAAADHAVTQIDKKEELKRLAGVLSEKETQNIKSVKELIGL